MSPILAVFVLGVLVMMVLPVLLIRDASYKKRFELMDGSALIRASIHAGMMKGRLRLAAYLVPLPIIILVRCFPMPKAQAWIIGAAFALVFVCLTAAQMFGKVERLMTAEMEKRKGSPDSGS